MKNWRIWVGIGAAAWILLNPKGVQTGLHNLQVLSWDALNGFMPLILVILGIGFMWKKVFGKKGGKS